MTRWRNRASFACGIIASVFLTAMMLLTVADVALRTFLNTPIRGVYEIIELLLACTFFFALPCAFLRDENIVVNTIDDYAPRLILPLKRLAALLAVVILAVMAWQGFIAARDSMEFNDITADLGLPRVLHWTALLIGIVGSALAALVMAIRREDAA